MAVQRAVTRGIVELRDETMIIPDLAQVINWSNRSHHSDGAWSCSTLVFTGALAVAVFVILVETATRRDSGVSPSAQLFLESPRLVSNTNVASPVPSHRTRTPMMFDGPLDQVAGVEESRLVPCHKHQPG